MSRRPISSDTKLIVKGSTVVARRGWPAGALPLEIFSFIAAYLPRSSVQSMRLVNKEFESKVSHFLFQVVVLPFRTELYGISLRPELAASQDALVAMAPSGLIKLQDEGMRVFQGFGQRISKFALSFEFDHEQLEYPPAKSDQEPITAFWGVYRWPYGRYNRYSHFEGLEKAADETATMAQALRCIVNAKELGLSLDGGLGWMAGPDITQRTAERLHKLPVFGESTFAPEPARVADVDMIREDGQSFPENDRNVPAVKPIKAALQHAGYDGNSLDHWAQMLIQADGYLERVTRSGIVSHSPDSDRRMLVRAAAQERETAATLLAAESDGSDGAESYASDDNESTPATTTPAVANDGESNEESKKTEAKEVGEFALKPNNLTRAQREMLLEVEWAQRAFMQSYTIAVIDNKPIFEHIHALTVARLPSRHLPSLGRSDFWDSLPGLEKLSLGIIPDWRELVKLPTSWIQDDRVLPSHAVSVVYTILRDHVLHRTNIKTLHLEWVGGGEEAPGIFTRNQHILPAPLTSTARNMFLSRPVPEVLPEMLSFPYVEHLSFKNCWISPPIMTRLIDGFEDSVIQSLVFDSVSLSATMPSGVQTDTVPPRNAFAEPAQILINTAVMNNPGQFVIVNAALGLINLVHNPPPYPILPDSPMPVWLMGPRIGSWTYFINALTPGKTMDDMRYDQGYTTEKPVRRPTTLRKLTFKSCGYVRMPLHLEQTILDPEAVQSFNHNLDKIIQECEDFMMTTDDPTLGVIINHIHKLEVQTLDQGFNFTLGWDSSRAALFAECVQDGITHPGQGRFSGTVDMTI